MGLIAISSLIFLGGMYLMIAFAWWILQIIANWRIFIKAGEDGWKSIIPIYGDYKGRAGGCADPGLQSY